MKKFLAFLITALIIFSLVACDASGNTPEDGNKPGTQSSGQNLEPETGKTPSTEWPTNTIFPKPEGCTIVEVRGEDWKNYITVQWDSKEAAKNYIEIVKGVEGDSAEVIGQGDTEQYVYYGTYNITITSMNEAENIVLYK